MNSGEIKVQQKKIDDCDDERKADKKLMQDILFQKELNKKINIAKVEVYR